jgi:predicted  nucleic acid-binding Zn-ribbon protein
MNPKLTFDFSFSLRFADLFDFEVQASKAVSVSPSNPDATEGEYTLKAKFQQEILGHTAAKIDELFKEKARLESQEASAREKELDDAKKQWQSNLDKKEADLKRAFDNKKKRIDEKTAEANENLENEKRRAVENQKFFDKAQVALRKEVAKAKADFAADTAKATQALTNAQKNLEEGRKYWDEKLESAHRSVDQATHDLHVRFTIAE